MIEASWEGDESDVEMEIEGETEVTALKISLHANLGQ